MSCGLQDNIICVLASAVGVRSEGNMLHIVPSNVTRTVAKYRNWLNFAAGRLRYIMARIIYFTDLYSTLCTG